MNEPSAIDALSQALEQDDRFLAAIVFGSQVRGGARPDSDIDVAVLMRDAAARQSLNHAVIDTLGRLAMQVQRDVHLVDLELIGEDLRHSIFASGKRLFDRSQGRLHELHRSSAIAYVDAEYLRRMIDRLHRDKLERAGG